ncbi:MAG TPA: NrfD/PsrC family molybdoenzyme membrane anchor subunit [Nitrolancea sp.]|nr:NrfD/PsrC family molybdoenzyme membrane anchor subunit [Nitrolancea sp.]
MRYGFVIDNRKCIGCHACTTACKSENEVPLGVFRTWVKYTEKGTFPNTRRYFNVTRCNHCDNAPCITVCPTKALYRRPDGIVDFDSSRCIGCKSCMQACPYDALYIDPFEHTAAKCNYCAHRVDVGLLPACVIVCPEKAIIAGDLDDPTSEIAHLVATQPVAVRKPEQGTQPKLFYIDADAAALTPEAQTRQDGYLWGEVRPDDRPRLAVTAGDGPDHAAEARIAYDVHHPKPWGGKVATYLWTKSIGAGAALVAAILFLAGAVDNRATFEIAAPLIAILFILATTVLLVADLKRPERFWYLLLKPNPRSWLVWGGYILGAFGAVAFLWLVVAAAGLDTATKVLMALSIPLALAAAGYTAFLFGQAEGRDFWQSRLLLPHLIAQAIVAGAAALLLFGVSLGASNHELRVTSVALAVGLVLFAGLLLAELRGAHSNAHVARTVKLLTEGPYRPVLLYGVWLLGVLAPLLLIAATLLTGLEIVTAAFAASAALAGLWFWERIWVSAGQDVPLS